MTVDEAKAMLLEGVPPSPATTESVAEGLTEQERIVATLAIVERYGGIEGDHHKAWVLDQVVRILTGAGYSEFVKNAKDGEDGPDTYEWDEGIAP